MARATRSGDQIAPAPEDVTVRPFDVSDKIEALIEFLELELIFVEGQEFDSKKKKRVRRDVSKRIKSDLYRCRDIGVLHQWRPIFESWSSLALKAQSRERGSEECLRATRKANRYLKSLYQETDEQIRNGGS